MEGSCTALTLKQRALNNHEKELFESARTKHAYDVANNNTTIHIGDKNGVTRNIKAISYAAHYHVNAILATLAFHTGAKVEPVIRYAKPYVVQW